ncbi:hypothetical protein NGA_2084300, partial [Nannochloropsis gaditana CCMP526]|uniref:uncharacterized protein n=1 Tax=Nannochloropsis gaditana (strain CCMP526) TaxID=1093141 RepID=UPI00029F6C64
RGSQLMRRFLPNHRSIPSPSSTHWLPNPPAVHAFPLQTRAQPVVLHLHQRARLLLEGQGDHAQVPVVPILPHIQVMTALVALEDDHVVRVLRRLGRSREGGNSETELIAFLAGVHHQY